MNKKGLGKGLGALLPAISEAVETINGVTEISLKDIRVNKKQPRHVFDEEKLNELAASIREHGVVQPVIVRRKKDGKYELVAGERRWRASQKAGIEKIPAIVRELSEKEITEIALIENIQREDLNPIEEAMAYKSLMEDYGLTQEVLSARVGKSRPFIANTVRLLALPEKIRNMVLNGVLSAGHARAILAVPKTKQEEIAQKASLKGWSVRQTENIVKELLEEKAKKPRKQEKNDPETMEIEEMLRRKLSTKVTIKRGRNKGFIEIQYFGEDELQRLLEAIIGEFEL